MLSPLFSVDLLADNMEYIFIYKLCLGKIIGHVYLGSECVLQLAQRYDLASVTYWYMSITGMLDSTLLASI